MEGEKSILGRCGGVHPRFFGWSLSESGFSGLKGIFRMVGDRLLFVGRVILRGMNGRAAGRQQYGMHHRCGGVQKTVRKVRGECAAAGVGFVGRFAGGFEGRHKACPYRKGLGIKVVVQGRTSGPAQGLAIQVRFGVYGDGAGAHWAGLSLAWFMLGTGQDWGAGGMHAVEEAPGGIPAPGG